MDGTLDTGPSMSELGSPFLSLPNYQNNNQRPRRGRRRRRKRRTRRRRVPDAGGELGQYANMIADPCNSVIYPGIYGTSEGNIDRARNSISIDATHTAHSSGYIIWIPDYENNGSDEDLGNLFIWLTDDADTNPKNDGTLPEGARIYGEDLYGLTDQTVAYESAQTVIDPFNKLLTSGVAADSRTIAACVAVTYTGAMFDASGQLTYIEDLPVTSLLYGSEAGTPLSVNDLFTLCPEHKRFGVEEQELKFRPSDASEHFRNSTTGPIKMPRPAGAASFLTENATASDPTVFGIAWRGMNPTAALAVVLTKVAEWRPQPALGLVKPPPVALKTGSRIQPALRLLDQARPGWTKVVSKAIGSGAKWLARAAFTGVGAYFGGIGGGRLGNQVGNLLLH